MYRNDTCFRFSRPYNRYGKYIKKRVISENGSKHTRFHRISLIEYLLQFYSNELASPGGEVLGATMIRAILTREAMQTTRMKLQKSYKMQTNFMRFQ